jgi:integrase
VSRGTAGTGPAEQAPGPGRAGLLAKLMAAVRPEFRSTELTFDPEGPVFGGPLCLVTGCARTARARGLCWGHRTRWEAEGKPDVAAFAATTDPRWARQAPYLACPVPGCRYGRRCEGGLCTAHHPVWVRAGRPDLIGWLASLPTAGPAQAPPACRVPSCQLWVHHGSRLCWRHTQHWNKRGRPDVDAFAGRFDADTVPGHERVDLAGLGPQLRLEIQYALQRRHDERAAKARPATAGVVARLLAASGVASLLDRPEREWQAELRDRRGRATTAHAFLLYAYRQVDDLALGSGWEAEYPRDVWRLRSIGVDKPHAALRFDRIPQPWLAGLAKRWARLELSRGTDPVWVYTGIAAVTRFACFLAAAGAGSPAEVDRTLLERYLADLHTDLAGTEMHRKHIGRLNSFLQAVRQHEWDTRLPGNALFFPDDYPEVRALLPRALAEHVMAQLEDPANLDQWDNPAYRLITIILMRCGLRIGDATALAYDCVVRDAAGAPYLRYYNHKMKREALVPVDDELAGMIAGWQRVSAERWPARIPVLFPRPSKNPDGTAPTPTGTYRTALYRWLGRCDIRDEHGHPARLTPHQWRHTLGTRLINRDVPQEVVRKILDHDSHEMTAHYARLSDTTVRRHWEQARKVDVNGEAVTLDPDGPLAEAAWAKQQLSRATQALPNGYCGLPLQQSCPHANSCLTCPVFVTTAEFLPQHRAQHRQALQIISAAEARGQQRLAEMNRQVAGNLEKIITSLEGQPGQQEAAADAC